MFRTAEQIENAVFEIGETYLNEIGGYILEVNLKGARGSRKVEIIADTEKGITLDELTDISKKIEQGLDTTELFSEKYTLEVTSPGLDRPLETARDFRRRIDRDVQIEHTMLEPGEPIVGTITDVSEDDVTVKTEDKGELVVPLNQIIKAKLQLDW